MSLVSPLLKRAIYPALHHSGWLARVPPPGGYAVVNYHGVVPDDYSADDTFLDGNLVQPEAFRQQLQFLKAHYHVIHPEDFRAWIEQGKRLPARAILLTCDDGLVNNLTDMLPVLRSESVACLFFVTAASCGDDPGMLWYEELYHLMRIKPLSGSDLHLLTEAGADSGADWMRRVRNHCGLPQGFRYESRSARRWRLLNIAELKRLAEAGMSVGAHTLTHPVLSLCSDEAARCEIQGSKTELERVLGKPVWAFAYPFGNPATMGER